jgi:phosphoglycolate phosphatase
MRTDSCVRIAEREAARSMGYDLISFDLDGTLVDTAAEIVEAANRALESHGITRRPAAEIEGLIGAGTRELVLKLLARCFMEQPAFAASVRLEAVLASMDEHYAATTGTSALPYAGCAVALTQLKAAGLRLVCVTNKEYRHAVRVLQATHLESYFELVIGGDTLPEKKPHASVLRHVAQRIGVSTSRTAHLGDSAIDVAAARNAGVAAWAVPYGYNAGVPIEQTRPDRVFQSLGQVADHVLAGRETAATRATS